MNRLQVLKAALTGSASLMTLAQPAAAKIFDIPDGDLSAALVAYIKQSDSELVYADSAVRGHKSRGAKGDYTDIAALTQVLKGSGFAAQTLPSNTIVIVPAPSTSKSSQLKVAAASSPPPQSAIETVVVTAEKKSENIQQVPISVTALSQQQLTERQIAGGPDLLRDVPNMNFTKTNFTGYDIQIRGIGTQAISVTTDPAVAVAFNDIPFIRNHFFEQEFYDLQDAEVLRGPQGTLYGRNATAGVVNLKSALPTDQYEAMISADMGNYSNRRLEGMINIPIVGDTLDIRMAGEWTKRDGYTEDTTTNSPVDGRDLWSSRLSIGWKPASNVQVYLVWEHFSEDDDRLRSGKQLCKTDWGPGGSASNPVDNIGGQLKPIGPFSGPYASPGNFFTQGCLPASFYSPDAFETPVAYSLPYVTAPEFYGIINGINPYPGDTQSTNLRSIESPVTPVYRAKNDTLEFNLNYDITPSLTLTSQTGYNNDSLWSLEDYNRFDSVPVFSDTPDSPGGVFCDPQLGCSTRLIIDDLAEEHAWQGSQEFRLASNFSGPFNFTAGANYLHYETVENYYVFSNVFAPITNCYPIVVVGCILKNGFQYNESGSHVDIASGYIDPNPLSSLDNQGHNYFLSQNPYVLNSYATFGEANYNLTNDLKFTGGLRWTNDQKHFLDIPSWLVESGYGYPVTGVLNQSWERLTGRAVVNWTPQLDFTDQSMFYGSYSHGYKAGGANPPGALFSSQTATGQVVEPVHPLTFRPEYIEAFELGTKNTLLGGALTVDGDVFYYNYTGYQISEIVDRTAINNNYNAHAEGAELESNWEPLPGLKFGFTGGFEKTGLAGGDEAVDLMDRTAGHPGWVVVKPFINEASNCIFPTYVAEWFASGTGTVGTDAVSFCTSAYILHDDPLNGHPYVANPAGLPGYVGFDPQAGTPGDPYTGQNISNGVDYGPAPNNGAGFSKNLGGNQLPNAPHFTTSLTAEYTMPVSSDWAATLHADFYWQSQSWWRVFNDLNYDKLHGYSNVNLSLILTSVNGWQVMGYVKNVFDTTAITGAFLNSDDSGLTTNVFLTDPRLFGVRVTKHLDEGDGFWGSDYSGYDFFTGLFSDTDNGKPSLWIELGGSLDMVGGEGAAFTPPFLAANPTSTALWSGSASPIEAQRPPLFARDEEAKITFQPDGSDWEVVASVRYGRANVLRHEHGQQQYYKTWTHKYHHYTHRLEQYAAFSDTFSERAEKNLIMDFQAGKDVGLGLLGGDSHVDFGVRIAQFSSTNGTQMRARPDIAFHYYQGVPLEYFHSYAFNGHASRSFRGIGPSLSWNGSAPVWGAEGNELTADWGANGALLFGRQSTSVQHQTKGYYRSVLRHSGLPQLQYSIPSNASGRKRDLIVPNIGGFAGLSYRYNNAKISFGYRADVFFGALDGGIDHRHSETVNMSGPFANISFGLGG